MEEIEVLKLIIGDFIPKLIISLVFVAFLFGFFIKNLVKILKMD